MTATTVSLLAIPSWALPVGPKASSAVAATATREPTVWPSMPSTKSGLSTFSSAVRSCGAFWPSS